MAPPLNSWRCLPARPCLSWRESRKIDFAFIDGWHTFDYALADFFYIDKILKVGGIAVLDDADWPSIRKLCGFISSHLSCSVVGSMSAIPIIFDSCRRWLSQGRRRSEDAEGTH